MIDYQLLADASEFYEQRGYQRIEVPWMVTPDVDFITKPKDVEPLEVLQKGKNLIASGEQGFLYQMLKSYLPKGKYQTITPCFRNDAYDFTHSKVFMKLELIDTLNPGNSTVNRMVSDALDLFRSLFKEPNNVNTTLENDIIDINYNDIELGSYGTRKHGHLNWSFGTGLAEPRTSRLINLE
jgi:hypothetical protein